MESFGFSGGMPEEEEPKGGCKEGLRHAEEEDGKRRNTCQEVETI